MPITTRVREKSCLIGLTRTDAVPGEWIGTDIRFNLSPAADGETRWVLRWTSS